jgi:hypothetical protein
VLGEHAAGDGLAGPRQARDDTHEVDVDRPDDDDTARTGHSRSGYALTATG